MRDVTGGEGDTVIIMSRPVYDRLMLSSELSRAIDSAQFVQGGLEFSVKTVNGAAVIPVPSARMKTAYTFSADGEGGFAPAKGAGGINWVI